MKLLKKVSHNTQLGGVLFLTSCGDDPTEVLDKKINGQSEAETTLTEVANLFNQIYHGQQSRFYRFHGR